MKLIIGAKQGLYINPDRRVPFPHRTIINVVFMQSHSQVSAKLEHAFRLTEHQYVFLTILSKLNFTSSNTMPFHSLASSFLKPEELSSMLSKISCFQATDLNANDLN